MTSTREIILIQLGGCGNNLAYQFWDTIRKEHKLNHIGTFTGNYNDKNSDYIYFERMNSYFKERGQTVTKSAYIRPSKHYEPRAILIDDDSETLDVIKASSMGNLFNINNYISGSGFSSNRWSEHYYMTDTDIINNTMDIIRNELEKCDCFQGFQLCHNIGGGIGSGFTSLLLHKLYDLYPNTLNQTFTVYPVLNTNEHINIYNSILSMNKLLENVNQTFVIDNDALFNICNNVLNQNDPKYCDLNWIAHLAMNHVTAHFRYNINWYELNRTIRNMGINLVPFPKLHFLLLSYAPLHLRENTKTEWRKIKHYGDFDALNDAAWSESNFYANINSKDGKYLCVSHLWRGVTDLPMFMDYNAKLEMRESDNFVSWIPDSFKYSLQRKAEVTGACDHSLGIIANTTAMKGVYERMSKLFNKIFKHKTFIHLYIKDGMEEMELEISNNNLKDLIMEYQDKQDLIVELENDDGDEEEENEQNEENVNILQENV